MLVLLISAPVHGRCRAHRLVLVHSIAPCLALISRVAGCDAVDACLSYQYWPTVPSPLRERVQDLRTMLKRVATACLARAWLALWAEKARRSTVASCSLVG